MEKWFAKASEYIHAHRQEMVSELMELVKIPSIVRHGADDLPFGKAVDDALEASAQLYRKHGYPMQVSRDRKYALAICEGAGDGIGIYAHSDVVPVNDDWVKTKPFEPLEENGIIYGRGVCDNKSAIIETLYALRALEAAGVTLRNRITVYVGGCEEAGMQDIKAFVENEKMPAINVVPDGGFPMGIGEKGILRVFCRSRDTLCDVVKLDGGKAFNVVLDRVQVALKNGEAFTVDGMPAHASRPHIGDNAAVKAARQLEGKVCENDQKILSAFAHAIGDCFGGNLGLASEGPFGRLTCANGITYIENGHLTFTMDIRFGTELTNSDCVERLRSALENLGFTMEIKENKPGFLLDENAPEAQIVLQTCREVFEKPEAKPIRMSGGTYARMLKNAYSVDCAPCPIPEGLPKGHGNVHQSDEALTVDSMLQVTESLALMIARLDAYLQEKTN